MTEEQFEALVELIENLMHVAEIRSPNGRERAINQAKSILVEELL